MAWCVSGAPGSHGTAATSARVRYRVLNTGASTYIHRASHTVPGTDAALNDTTVPYIVPVSHRIGRPVFDFLYSRLTWLYLTFRNSVCMYVVMLPHIPVASELRRGPHNHALSQCGENWDMSVSCSSSTASSMPHVSCLPFAATHLPTKRKHGLGCIWVHTLLARNLSTRKQIPTH